MNTPSLLLISPLFYKCWGLSFISKKISESSEDFSFCFLLEMKNTPSIFQFKHGMKILSSPGRSSVSEHTENINETGKVSWSYAADILKQGSANYSLQATTTLSALIICLGVLAQSNLGSYTWKWHLSPCQKGARLLHPEWKAKFYWIKWFIFQ